MRTTIIAAALVSASAGAAHAADTAATVTGLELRRCGTYAHQTKGKESDNASTSGTHNIVDGLALEKESREVQAALGRAFGCEVMILGSPKGAQATFTAVLQPPGDRIDPRTKAPFKPMRGSKTYPIGEAGGYVGFTFRSEAVMVPGEWTLEVLVGERRFGSTTFKVAR